MSNPHTIELVCVGLSEADQSLLKNLPEKKTFLQPAEFAEQVTSLPIVSPIIFYRQQGRLRTLLAAKEIDKLSETPALAATPLPARCN